MKKPSFFLLCLLSAQSLFAVSYEAGDGGIGAIGDPLSGGTASRFVTTDSDGKIQTDSDTAFDGTGVTFTSGTVTTLNSTTGTITNLIPGGLTTNRVPYYNGTKIVDDADLGFDGTTLTPTNITIGGHRVGAFEGIDASLNILVQFSSATVNGSAAIDFTDSGLKDYGAAPFVILQPLFNSDGNTQLVCDYHTVSTTGMTIECTLGTGDGVAQTIAADGTNRQVNYILMGTAP